MPKTEPAKVKAGELMAMIQYIKMKNVRNGGTEMVVDGLDNLGKGYSR